MTEDFLLASDGGISGSSARINGTIIYSYPLIIPGMTRSRVYRNVIRPVVNVVAAISLTYPYEKAHITSDAFAGSSRLFMKNLYPDTLSGAKKNTFIATEAAIINNRIMAKNINTPIFASPASGI